ncbi:MAG TPA: hypothetical protein VIJ38_16640 [Acidobacteriaceae bacterium]
MIEEALHQRYEEHEQYAIAYRQRTSRDHRVYTAVIIQMSRRNYANVD